MAGAQSEDPYRPAAVRKGQRGRTSAVRGAPVRWHVAPPENLWTTYLTGRPEALVSSCRGLGMASGKGWVGAGEL
jgi:hypothetical protein